MQQLKTRTTCLLLGLLVSNLFYLNGYSQLSIGIEEGWVKNDLVTNNANRNFTNYQPGNGLSASIPIHYKISPRIAVALDPGIIQKNYRQVRSGFFEGVYQNNSNTYIQLPVMAHFVVGDRHLKGFLNTGLYASYWMSSRIKGNMPNILDPANEDLVNTIYDVAKPFSYNEKHVFQAKDNRFEAGWIGGLGASYAVNNRYEVFSEARMLYSLTDTQKKYMIGQVPRYNTTYGIHVGLLVALHKNL